METSYGCTASDSEKLCLKIVLNYEDAEELDSFCKM